MMLDPLLALCIVGVVLQVADYATTRLVLERGTGVEANSIVRRLIGWFGIRGGLIFAKLVAIAGYAAFYHYRVDWYAPAAFNLIYLIVVINNHRIAQR